MDDERLANARSKYAKRILGAFLISDPRLESAFADVRREDFLGPGPWQLFSVAKGYHPTPDADPIHVYQDLPVGLMPGRSLNNGHPSFLAFLIYLGHLKDGDRAVHIGAGVGYYTAVMAHLVGTHGAVTAIEYEPELTARAAHNLSRLANVRVIQGDGFTLPLEPADVIYVNAGASRPADTWLNAMKDGARMILPLAVVDTDVEGRTMTRGAIFRIERHGDEYSARWMSPTSIFACAGAHDAASEAALTAAFQKGGWDNVTRLYRTGDISDENCWVRGRNWSLAYH
jgi:protein-L-isoaspartate(D-aspartate) O-methyltransferase